jgi:PleD family two-component response regulator
VLWTRASPMNAETSPISRVKTTSAFSRYADGASSSIANTPRVLVIDDDPSMQHMIVNYLEQHNMQAVAASQRQEMIRQFTWGSPPW